MFSYLLGYWFYTSACTCQYCVQHCLCLYDPMVGSLEGVSYSKNLGNFSCPTCPFPCAFSSLFHPCEKLVKHLLPSWRLGWVLLLPLLHQPAALWDVTAPGFSQSQQVTLSREPNVSAGLWGLRLFPGNAAVVGTLCSGRKNEVWHSQNSLNNLMDISM